MKYDFLLVMSVCFTFQNSDFRHTKVSEKFRTRLLRNRSLQIIQRWKDIFKDMNFAFYLLFLQQYKFVSNGSNSLTAPNV